MSFSLALTLSSFEIFNKMPLPKRNYRNGMAKLGPYMAHMWEWYGKTKS